MQSQKKKERNIELLLLYQRLLDLQESCWTKLLRFQKTEFFISFETNYSVPGIINLRLDDFIYYLLLIVIEVIFGALPMNTSNPLTTPYRQSLALYFLTTFITMISPHWFRWVTLAAYCLGYPTLIYVTMNGYISLMPINTNDYIYNYLGYLSLVPIFILLILINPLRQLIRNSVGAFYSYVYGLSLSLILYLWPLYSLINELSQTGTIDYSFITNNQPLITAFIIIVVTGFYFFIHNALFQPKLENIQEMLFQQFSKPDLDAVLQQVQQSKVSENSCLYSNFHCFVRSMSFIIYSITIALELYLYYNIVSNPQKITSLGVLMGYIIIFLLFGAFYIYIRVDAAIILPIVGILSLGTAVASLFYYNSSVSFQTYAYVSLSGPFIAIFWSIIKNTSRKALIFRTNAIIALYLTIFLPVVALVLNSLNLFTSDSSIASVLNLVLLSIIGITLLLLLIMFVVWQVKKHKLQNTEQQKSRVPVDYNYFQQGNPQYKLYEVKQEYGVGYLSSIDLRQIGYMAGLIFFIVSELMSIHAVNMLRTEFASTSFYSSSINQIIYSQFSNILIFYLYTHTYLANPEGSVARNIYLVIFILIALGTLITGFFVSSGTTTLKIVGGFALIMLGILIALEAIKSAAQKIFGFVSAIVVIALWIFIVLPYVQIIPFASIYADQTNFGTFIYGCIVGSVVLLILLVGILTLVFNRLIDKFEEEKKYKFVMQDVITLLHEEGIQSNDSQLHIFYESFMYRDKKYVFFLKRGFPVNLLQDPEDHITKLVTSEDYSLKRVPTKKQLTSQQEKKSSLLWSCLTCCCGEDQQEIQEKLGKAKKVIDRQELQSLLPQILLAGLQGQRRDFLGIKKKKKWKSPAAVYSSKSLLLKNLHVGPRYLGDEYILLKTSKNADLAIEIWHNIFDFASNKDQGEEMIISNDFHLLLGAAEVVRSQEEIDQIFSECASNKWGMHSGMNLQDFALAIEKIASSLYEDKGEQGKFYLLINQFFYNLALYQQFNSFMIEKKTTKRATRQEIKNSPFQLSYKAYLQHRQQRQNQETKFISKVNKFNTAKHINLEPIKETAVVSLEEIKYDKGPSCKKVLYEKIKACTNCCKKEETQIDFERKMFVRPWELICVESVRIMQKKENDWDSVVEAKEHPFRLTSNNLIMAGAKLLDLFTYVTVSILNPQIGWISGLTSSNLYLNYYVQTYLAVGVIAISVPFGIRGIMLIFQDRLGLTQNRLPAAFPHPMFFFTFFYKLLILALFNIVSQTFLNTFNCNWTSATQPYTLIDDSSVECFSSSHNMMVLISLVCLIAYYPLSSYAMPNFQFAEKNLDLKYRPSYLILYFQVNFILLACKVLLSGTSVSHQIQLINNSVIIFALTYLAFSVIGLKPCFVLWFNWVEFGVIAIGLVVNVMGLVLYITGQWAICVIATFSLCGAVLIIVLVIIKKGYFSAKISDEKQADEQQYKQLQLMWGAKQKKDKALITFNEDNSRDKLWNKYEDLDLERQTQTPQKPPIAVKR